MSWTARHAQKKLDGDLPSLKSNLSHSLSASPPTLTFFVSPLTMEKGDGCLTLATPSSMSLLSVTTYHFLFAWKRGWELCSPLVPSASPKTTDWQ